MKKTLLISLVLVGTIILKAQSPDLSNKIDSIVKTSISEKTPGCVVGIVKDGKVLFRKTYGMSNLDYRIPVSDSTLFNLASVSKQFTAFLILMLEKEGKLNLDDPLEKYLPELKIYGPAVTIRQLLHHTSGIPSTDNLKLVAGLSLEMPWDAEDEFNMILTYQKLNFKPNTAEVYSNANYFLLARIVEKVTGKTFSQAMSEKVFNPLNMKTATIYDTPGKVILNRASGYRKSGEGYIKANTEGDAIFGSTNLYVSLNDMINWCINLTTHQLGGTEISDKQFNRKDKLNNGDTIGYTYGFFTGKRRGLRTAEHGGFTMGFKDQVSIVPELGFSMFVLSNNESIDQGDMANKIADVYLKDFYKPEIKKDRKEISIKKELYQRYSGSYIFDDGMVLRFENRNDTLKLIIPGAPEFTMYPEKDNEFFLKDFDAQCKFEIDDKGKLNGITWRQNNANPKGVPYSEPRQLTQKDLLEYIGNYENQELNVTYPVRLNDNALMITLPKTFRMIGLDTKLNIVHRFGDVFHGNLGKIVFTRDTTGKITGFVITDIGRVKNIEFKKRT